MIIQGIIAQQTRLVRLAHNYMQHMVTKLNNLQNRISVGNSQQTRLCEACSQLHAEHGYKTESFTKLIFFYRLLYCYLQFKHYFCKVS